MKKNLLMVLGPTEVEQDILGLASEQQEYMRTEDYSLKWKQIFSDLKYVFQTENPVIVYASSGTGAMEAAVTNFVSTSDSVLYINAGSFGKRWGDICKKHRINAIEIPFDFGSSPNPLVVNEYLAKNPNVKVLFATLNETSSGALSDIEAIGKVVKNYKDVLFIVDCVSGLLVDEFNTDKWGVDVAVSASQKAFALPPGLSFMSVSQKALERAKESNLRTFYFDIFDYVNNQKRNQTPFTPAVSLVNQLQKRLEKIKSEGLENFRNRYRENSEYLRSGLRKIGLKELAKNPANCVTAVLTEDFDANLIVKIMRDKYNIEIAPSGGDLKTKLFRIGNYGNIGREEIEKCLDSLRKTLKEIE